MNMHFESEIEINAIHAYRTDPFDEEDEQLFGKPLRHLPPGAQIEL